MAVITINGNDYFSYSSVADADIYLATFYNSAAWFLLDDETKGKHLVAATNWLNSLPWKDECSPQSVRETNLGVITATQLVANSIANGETSFLGGSVPEPGIKELGAGSAKIVYQSTYSSFYAPTRLSGIPLFIRSLIAGCLGSLGASGFGGAISYDTDNPSKAKEPWNFTR